MPGRPDFSYCSKPSIAVRICTGVRRSISLERCRDRQVAAVLVAHAHLGGDPDSKTGYLPVMIHHQPGHEVQRGRQAAQNDVRELYVQAPVHTRETFICRGRGTNRAECEGAVQRCSAERLRGRVSYIFSLRNMPSARSEYLMWLISQSTTSCLVSSAS